MRVFDIVGPVMIGPSSSHTAGAVRIGRVARRLLGEPVASARIGLTGSFLATGKGHGTDRALVAGLMDFNLDDPRIRSSLALAKEAGLAVSFYGTEKRDAHPNTALLSVVGTSGKALDMTAASVGGGAIRVTEINGLPVSFTGDAHTLILSHRDEPGVIARVTSLISSAGVNIATMQVFRRRQGGQAAMVLEVDAPPAEKLLGEIAAAPGVRSLSFLKRL